MPLSEATIYWYFSTFIFTWVCDTSYIWTRIALLHDDDKVVRTFLKLQGLYWNNWQLMHEIELWGIVQESNHAECDLIVEVFVPAQREAVQVIVSTRPLWYTWYYLLSSCGVGSISPHWKSFFLFKKKVQESKA